MVRVALELVPTLVDMLVAILPKALPRMQGMVCLNVILSLLLENGLLSKDQVAKLELIVCVGLGWGFG